MPLQSSASPTFDVHDAVSLNFVHSQSEPEDYQVIYQVAGSDDMTNLLIGFVTKEWEQLHNPLFRQIRERFKTGQVLPLQLDMDGILQHTVHSNPVIAIPKSLQHKVIHIAHNTEIVGHRGDRKMFSRLRRHFNWLSVSVDSYKAAKDWTSCARERVKLRKHATDSKTYPATKALAYVSIDILDLFPSRAKAPQRYWHQRIVCRC